MPKDRETLRCILCGDSYRQLEGAGAVVYLHVHLAFAFRSGGDGRRIRWALSCWFGGLALVVVVVVVVVVVLKSLPSLS